MRIRLKIIAILGLSLFPGLVQAQHKPSFFSALSFKNRFDKNGLHHGKWSFKTDVPETNEQLKTKGRYAHGYMVGNWRTYYPNKKLKQLEKCSFKEGKNILETTQYYSNGQIARKGLAVLEILPEKRFYRYGDWHYFTEAGRPDKTIFYDNGWPAKITYANGRLETSKAQPPNFKVSEPGEQPSLLPGKTESIKMTKDKDNRTIMIHYKANGDSTVTVMQKK